VTDETLTFEQAEAELRTIVERLETGDVGIDEAIALWERGEALYEICRDRLDSAVGKVEELAARVQAGKPSA
jgi:exodeoxyribonuclease VII small subunit